MCVHTHALARARVHTYTQTRTHNYVHTRGISQRPRHAPQRHGPGKTHARVCSRCGLWSQGRTRTTESPVRGRQTQTCTSKAAVLPCPRLSSQTSPQAATQPSSPLWGTTHLATLGPQSKGWQSLADHTQTRTRGRPLPHPTSSDQAGCGVAGLRGHWPACRWAWPPPQPGGRHAPGGGSRLQGWPRLP